MRSCKSKLQSQVLRRDQCALSTGWTLLARVVAGGPARRRAVLGGPSQGGDAVEHCDDLGRPALAAVLLLQDGRRPLDEPHLRTAPAARRTLPHSNDTLVSDPSAMQ